MKKYINSKILKIRSARNPQEAYINVCSEIMEQYDNGKVSSGEALTVIKNCLKNISKIRVLPSALALLWQNKLPTIATILTVAIVTLLIVITNTIKNAAIDKQQNWINNSGADIIVASPGTMDLLGGSFLSESDLQRIKNTNGLDSAQGIIYYFSNITTKENKYLTLTFQGFEPSIGYGGPWKLSEGRSVENNGEVVLDSSLKKDLNTSIGQSIELAGHTYTIVGFSKDTQAISKQTIFLTNSDALRYVARIPYYNFIIIKSHNHSETLTALKNQGFNAMSRSEFANNNFKYWNREVAPTMDLIIIASITLGFTILVLIFIVTSHSRKRQIGIFKSVGATNRKIALIEITSLGITSSVGVLLGIFLSYIGILVINQHSTGLDARLSNSSYLIGVTFVLVIIIISGLPIFRQVSKINPLIAKKKLYGITLFSLQD